MADETTLRVVSLNVSGLPADPHGIKYQDLLHFITDFSIDILCISEVNLAWHCLPETSHFSQITRHRFRSTASKVACYQDRTLTSSFQRGGVAILVRDSHTGRVCGTGADPMGLGRWAWMRLRGHHGSHLRIFSAYRPVPNPRDVGSVWNQQREFFLAQDPPRDCDPRQAFLTDLAIELQTAYDAGDTILVALDANEPTLWQPHNPVASAFSHTASLHDVHLQRHDSSTAPATHNRGSRPIDSIFGSAFLAPYKSGYKPFGAGPGDHRPLWLDLSIPSVFGISTKAATPVTARRLQGRDPRVVKRYQDHLLRHYQTHNIPARTFALEASIAGPLSDSQSTEWESLDTLRTQGIFAADFSCRRLRTGAVPWTPRVAHTLATHRFWDRYYQFRIGRHVGLSYLRRLSRKAGLDFPSETLPLDEIQSLRQQAWEAYRSAKKSAPKQRVSFLSDLAQARSEAGLESAASGLTNMLRRKQQRRDAALLRSILKPGQRSGLSTVDVPRPGTGTWTDGDWTGDWDTHTDRHGLEQGCLQENDRRFRQATGTDLLTPPMVQALGPMGTSPLAHDLLKYGARADLDSLPISTAACQYLVAH